VFSFENKVLMD